MVEHTEYHCDPKRLERIQFLVKSLDLKSFRFMNVYKSFIGDHYYIRYSCDQKDGNKLGEFLKQEEIKPLSLWRRFKKNFYIVQENIRNYIKRLK